MIPIKNSILRIFWIENSLYLSLAKINEVKSIETSRFIALIQSYLVKIKSEFL
jgi:hypothetical protein